EDIRKGEIVLPAGTPLGPAQLGVLASIAQGAPLVHRAPRVAFMGSGDEIVDLDRADEILAGRKIATSNSYTLHALIRRAGGFPGNPVSTMVTFELFVRPAIRRLLGHRLPFRRTVPVCVEEPITLGPKLRHFLRAVVRPEGPGGGLVARLTGPQGSGILTSMARANALL